MAYTSAETCEVKIEQDVEDFENCSIEEALGVFGTKPDLGLSSKQAFELLSKHGPNKLPESHENKFLKFLRYMWNPLSWCMEIAAVVALAVLDWVDAVLILALLLVNAAVGYYEEANADGAIAALMASLSPKARVLRDGKISQLDAGELVPGDIVSVKFGEILPADVKILGDENAGPLLIDQAALTGESLPVKRFPGQVGYSGSIVKQGESRALVYATGKNTFFGKAASLIKDGGDNTGHLQKVMTTIGFVCVGTISLWVALQLGIQFGYYDHECFGGVGGCPTLTNVLVVVVGGIPIAMPTVLSVTLAIGAYNLTSKGVIVSRLTAIEELAGMDILCSDKTGTLTLNKLSVDHANLEPQPGFTRNDILLYGALSAKEEGDEPIDVCLHNAYSGKESLWDHFECIKYTPFDPVSKRTVAFVRGKGDNQGAPKVKYSEFQVAKGAPQVILALAQNFEEIHVQVEKRILEYASRGYRALGVAVADSHSAAERVSWEFVGLVPLFDPPRHDTKQTIDRALELGIGVKMITGDQLPIGKETARQLGMGNNMFSAGVIQQGMAGGLVEGMVPLDDLIEQADGFAEVFPEHKYEIVKRLQEKKGHICGMTGDGVNDAPALSKADVGIAVSGATDAARSAADIVLTEEGLSVIIDAVTGSREIFQRMKSYAKYTVSVTIRICFTFGLLTTVHDWYFPPLLIVMLAIFNDGAMIALSKDRVTASQSPDAWFLSKVFGAGFGYGIVQTISTLILFEIAAFSDFFPGIATALPSLDIGEGPARFCDSLQKSKPEFWSQFSSPEVQAAYAAAGGSATAADQCEAEVYWLRASMLRSFVYAAVSISGMMLIFVVRCKEYSFASRPATALLVAFVVSQTVASIVAGFGFKGYTEPVPSSEVCYFCQAPGLNLPQPYNGPGPVAGTEGLSEPSVIGCGWYVLVAWIWSIIWHLGMDPLKFAMMWFLNEDDFRKSASWFKHGFASTTSVNRVSTVLSNRNTTPAGLPTFTPLERTVFARASAPPRPSPAQFHPSAAQDGIARRSGLSRPSMVQRGNIM
uniref:Plasma membrane ATPase n=1 Tax=Tetraselmis sp. GSL018 TaxID=582737 RepID=A0A061RTM6_9CHLO|eukprot:CAMPEP_0177621158 /NCGR_PEP_ID=MMETSP0419_2-20121207/27406_1 /TAXON_ID=582737 /ORGANISM="Tetraselmis sp., Strain GSL018" /LENGTH=1042 /DNA_ID=CAMNT_0019120997 /DNA_START=98 /DNA_END=3226 /DNA_ORIENTATION=-